MDPSCAVLPGVTRSTTRLHLHRCQQSSLLPLEVLLPARRLPSLHCSGPHRPQDHLPTPPLRSLQIQNVSFTDSPVHLELDLRPPSYDTVMNAGRRPQSTLVVQNNTSNDSLPHPSGQQFRGGQRPRVNSTPQSNTQYMRAPLPPVPTSRARAPTIHITAPAEPIHPNAIQEGSSPLLSASPPRIPLPQPPAAGTLRQPPLTPLNPVRRSRAQSAVAPGSSSRPVGARNPDSSNRREMGGIYSGNVRAE
ncbi:hypothetical protein B0H16DRAFT_726085 [Mycena metata]|uniref:Uncharacterized protein n=1 Tax=Mycena metata TaxID=1033252 RepID=A0AAD7K775_9AGAR|nr:hypothetical protein B0H16DRAFT_726085 [Mycena metata]